MYFACGILKIQEFLKRVKGLSKSLGRVSPFLWIKSKVPPSERKTTWHNLSSLQAIYILYSSLYTRQMICRQIWIFWFHELIKKTLVLWIEAPWHRRTKAFPTSGSNDLPLSNLQLPGPHRCADRVLANLPSHVLLPIILLLHQSLQSSLNALLLVAPFPTPRYLALVFVCRSQRLADLRFTFPKTCAPDV